MIPHDQISAQRLAILRIWVNAVFLLDVLTTSFRALGRLPVEIMHPPGVMEWLSWKFFDRLLTPTGMQGLQILLVLSLAASLLGIFTSVSTKTSLALVVLYQGILRSFGHFNHDEMAGVYFLLVLAFVPCGHAYSLDRRVRDRQLPLLPAVYYSYPVTLMQAILAWVYLSTGLLKLRIGGLSYFSPDQLPVLSIQHSLDNLHDTQFQFALLLPSIRSFTPLMLAVVVLWEITFPLGVFWKKTRWWYLGFGVVFHVSTVLLMNIAFWNQLAMYVVFVDFQRVRAFAARLLDRAQDPLLARHTASFESPS